MPAAPPNFIRVTRCFEAAAEQVFDAWLDPARARQWLFTDATSTAYVAGLDARVGGTWTITDTRAGQTYTGVGEYLVLERPHRLVFTFAMPQFAPDVDKITVDLEAAGAGCILTLTQQGLAKGSEGPTIESWARMFEALVGALRRS